MGIGTTNIGSAIDPVLQGLWTDKEQDPADYVGLVAAPAIPHDGITGQYLRRSGIQRLNLDPTDDPYTRTDDMAVDAPSRPAPGSSFTTDSFTMKHRSDNRFVPDALRAQLLTAHSYDLVEDAVDELWHMHRGIHEYDVFADIYGTDGSFTTATAKTSAQVSTTTTDYYKEYAQVAERTLIQTAGRRPTHTFMSLQTAQAVVLNDDVRKAVALSSDDQQVALSALAAWHRAYAGTELVIVRSMYENASGSTVEFLGDRIAFVVLGDSPNGKSFCNTFINSQLTEGLETDAPALSGMRSVDEDDPKGVKVIADMYQVVKAVNPDFGIVFTDVLA